MKKVILFLHLSMLSLSLLAGPVEPKRAAKVAASFWASKASAKSAPAHLIDRSSEWQYTGIYLFTNPDGGFVLVAADDNAKPILGYSMTGTLQPDAIPPQLHSWLSGYQQQLDALASLPQSTKCAYDDDAELWLQLTSGNISKDADSAGVAPLLTTLWNQTYPYNILCPAGTVTGCAATAQAQMMNYWKFPAFGQGKHSYSDPNYGLLMADFEHTCFEWNKMPDSATMSTPQEEKEAVSTLMYTIGVSLEMNYGTAADGGSAALGLVGMPGYHSIDNSLQDYFHYSRDMYVAFKEYGYTNMQWRDLLVSEINLRHPVLYGGYATQGGHGFVCDGYDSRQYMHFNFGWSGVGDGYYPVDSISPGVGGVGGNVTYTFNQNNSALIGAVPIYAMRVSDTVFTVAYQGLRDSLLFSVNDTLQAPWSVSCDVDWITIEPTSFDRAGWVVFQVDSCEEITERVGWITFTQANQTIQVKIIQANFDIEQMCPLTIVMESTKGDGWKNGAHLTIESSNGYVFGTARLTVGTRDSVVIQVPHSDVYSVWHSGGGSDRYINYYIRNAYGQNLVEAVYAFRSGGTHHITAPCEQLSVKPLDDPRRVSLYPNPVASNLHISADDLLQVDILDMSGRTLLTGSRSSIDLSNLPNGLYFVRILTRDSSTVQRIVKK